HTEPIFSRVRLVDESKNCGQYKRRRPKTDPVRQCVLQVSTKQKFLRQRNQDRGCKPKCAPLQDLRAAKRQRAERIGVKSRHTTDDQADLANAYEHPLPKSSAESAFEGQPINRNRLG